MSASHVIGVFAKQPEPGKVKTRLAAATSAEWAAQVAEAFLLDTVERVTSINIRRYLVFAPPASRDYFAKIAGDHSRLTPQADGDLGERMASFFADQLGHGARTVIVLGTDSPTLPTRFLAQAFDELQRVDVVLGPATDGGYYLVGCAGQVPEIFSGIPWGSARVLDTTIRALESSRHRLALLPPWYDVDTLEDWQMLCGHVAAQRRAGIDPGVPHTERLLHVQPA